MEFECLECHSKTVFDTDTEDYFITSTSTFVCPSCQTLYDLDKDKQNVISKSKFDKTNYRTKTEGIDNQLAISQTKHPYTVPCPHCKHIYEMKGIPVKSVHWCSSCYQYFGIDDVKITMLPRTGTSSWMTERMHFKHDFQVSRIYPPSLFYHDIDKLADWWSKYDSKKETETELKEAVVVE